MDRSAEMLANDAGKAILMHSHALLSLRDMQRKRFAGFSRRLRIDDAAANNRGEDGQSEEGMKL